jgi:hypothetical protein
METAASMRLLIRQATRLFAYGPHLGEVARVDRVHLVAEGAAWSLCKLAKGDHPLITLRWDPPPAPGHVTCIRCRQAFDRLHRAA